MDRRQFLSWAAAGSTGLVLPGCGGGGGSATPTPAPTPAPTPTPDPLASEWQALAAQLPGRVLRSGDADFERLAAGANARYGDQRPRGLLRATSAADITAGLAFARRLGLKPRLRSGAHSYLGWSSGGDLLIDVGALNSVRLDGELAYVGAGATLADVYEALIAQGRCIPAGSCLSVGITGLTLGGGFGVTDREHGLSCDALRGASLIGADGQLLQADARQNPELFWALRGGGGGWFGVVTELRFQTHAIAPLTRFEASFGLDALPALLGAWQAWPASGLPDGIWSQLAVSASGCTLWGLGSLPPSEVQAWFEGLLSHLPANGQRQPLQTLSYRELMLGDCQGLSTAQCHLPAQNGAGQLRRVAMAASSDFFDQPVPAAGAEALANALRQRGTQPGAVLLNLMGGAIARVPVDATAFVHRNALFSAQYLAEYPAGSSSAQLEQAAQWTHGLRELMKPWSSGRAYQNYLDGLITDPGSACFGAQLPRLQALRAQLDPQGLLAQAQGLIR